MDLQNFSVTRSGTVNLNNVPQWIIEGQITDSQTGAVLFDFTGANSVKFPQVLGQLSNAKQNKFVEFAVLTLLKMRFGLDPDD